jgi:hypothetical protein
MSTISASSWVSGLDKQGHISYNNHPQETDMARFKIIEGNGDSGNLVVELETIEEVRATLRRINPRYERVLIVRYGNGDSLGLADRLALAGISDP